jgi:gluconate/galactonate dehydratase
MDVGIDLVRSIDGALAYPRLPSGDASQSSRTALAPQNVRHPFAGIRISNQGLEKLQEYVRTVRDIVGWDIPLAVDHIGRVGIEDAIKIAQAMDPFNLAWIEDAIPWDYTDDYVRLRNSCKTPLATGEDIYLKEGFLPLFEKKAISYCNPDLATSGGLLETKKIGDLAMDHGVCMAMHMAGSPILLFASVHCAAATENFLVLEHHDVDNPAYEGLVEGVPKPFLDKNGFVQVPDAPGLGVTINEEAFKEMIRKNRRGGGDPEKLFFPPTEEWNNERSMDRPWSLNTSPAAERLTSNESLHSITQTPKQSPGNPG